MIFLRLALFALCATLLVSHPTPALADFFASKAIAPAAPGHSVISAYWLKCHDKSDTETQWATNGSSTGSNESRSDSFTVTWTQGHEHFQLIMAKPYWWAGPAEGAMSLRQNKMFIKDTDDAATTFDADGYARIHFSAARVSSIRISRSARIR